MFEFVCNIEIKMVCKEYASTVRLMKMNTSSKSYICNRCNVSYGVLCILNGQQCIKRFVS